MGNDTMLEVSFDKVGTKTLMANFCKMEKNGRVGQLFITGKEDISQYVNSEENSVFVAIGENDNVMAATYITQGQKPFTYNDITKYFKAGKIYDKHVRDGYERVSQYRSDLLDIYKIKLLGFKKIKYVFIAVFCFQLIINTFIFSTNCSISKNQFRKI